MICKVKETIERFSMLKGAKSVAVGLSGGADSVCLFDILFRLQGEYGFALKAVHVNHNLRGEEALSDCEFVKELCRKRGVLLEIVSADVSSIAKEKKLGLEECGRLVRYKAFENSGCDKVAVAHTLSDSIETSLFNLTRGSSISGVCGISPLRGNIIRPLIFCSRDEVLEYCRKNRLKFVTDSSNLSDDYSRNFLRHNVVPLLKELNPGLEQSFLRFFESAKDDEEFLKKKALETLGAARLESGFLRKPFLTLDRAILNRCIHLMLEERMNKQVESRHIELVANVIGNTGKIQLSQDLFISVTCDIIDFQFASAACKPWTAEERDNVFSSPYKSYELVNVREHDSGRQKDAFDFSLVAGRKLTLRSRKQGDSFSSPSRNNTKSLKKLFNEMKIPREEREKLAVLECDGLVVWVEGIGTNRPFIVTDKTDNPVKIKIKEG